MNRRKFLQFLGAGAAATATGLMVPDVARRFFLPPRVAHVDLTFDREMSLNDFERRILEPAIQRVAAEIDKTTWMNVTLGGRTHYIPVFA